MFANSFYCATQNYPGIFHSCMTHGQTCPKKLQLVFADAISAAVDHFSVLNPVSITTSTLTCLQAFRFCCWDHELHSDGLLPMAFVSPDVSPGREALDAQNLYTLRSGGLVPLALTLTDIKELYTAKGYIYTRWSAEKTRYLPTSLCILNRF